MSEEKNNTGTALEAGKLALQAIALITAIGFIKDVMGKGKAGGESDDNEAAAKRARQRLYKLVPPSFNDQVYRDYADILDKAILRQSTENEKAVYDIMQQMKNISDIAKLIDFFGHRREMFTTYYISLPQSIHEFMDDKEKDTINYILRSKKIDYKFL
jgi:hypothetical protein